MVCFGVEPGSAGWKALTNLLSYGGTPYLPSLARTYNGLKMYLTWKPDLNISKIFT